MCSSMLYDVYILTFHPEGNVPSPIPTSLSHRHTVVRTRSVAAHVVHERRRLLPRPTSHVARRREGPSAVLGARIEPL